MTRRELLLASVPPLAASQRPQPTILVHEHVLVDFIGADAIRPGRYDAEEVFRVARPKLEEIARLGCVRLLEATPEYLGRDARLMRRLAEATGVEIWINTGLYGAASHKYVPGWAREAPAAELARRWIGEAARGVDGVKPRFIKTGVNKAPLHELDRKLVRAAAIASREVCVSGSKCRSESSSSPKNSSRTGQGLVSGYTSRMPPRREISPFWVTCASGS